MCTPMLERPIFGQCRPKTNLVVKNLTFGMFTTPKVHFLDFEKLTAE
jgi:hypothetical protein